MRLHKSRRRTLRRRRRQKKKEKTGQKSRPQKVRRKNFSLSLPSGSPALTSKTGREKKSGPLERRRGGGGGGRVARVQTSGRSWRWCRFGFGRRRRLDGVRRTRRRFIFRRRIAAGVVARSRREKEREVKRARSFKETF